jgi:dipeptidyl aminopeptidase/acylaminoacyl peptidase
VSHAGLFNSLSLYSSDVPDIYGVLYGGYASKPGSAKEIFDKWDPARYVENWDTPILIIHSDKDNRHPVSMSTAAFTTLQMRGVESVLEFP